MVSYLVDSLHGDSEPFYESGMQLRRSFQGGKPGPPGDLDDHDNEFEGADTNYADNEGDIGGFDETYEAHSDDHFLPADNAHVRSCMFRPLVWCRITFA